MSVRRPHYLLFSQADLRGRAPRWSFVLQTAEGAEQLRAAESEADANGERLELLSVVRGLEALPAPSRVTLVTESDYVRRGIHFGIDEWRSNNWQWERFGEMVPVKNLDLWRRIDRALAYHEISLKRWRVDAAHSLQPAQSARGDAKVSVADKSSIDNRFPAAKKTSHIAGPSRRAKQMFAIAAKSVASKFAVSKSSAPFKDEIWSEEAYETDYETDSEIESLDAQSFEEQSDFGSDDCDCELLESAIDQHFIDLPTNGSSRRWSILFLKRKIFIAQFRFVARVKELLESVIWFTRQFGTPLIARPWNDYQVNRNDERKPNRVTSGRFVPRKNEK